MIQEQQDVYFIEGNPQKGYSQYSTKIGVILAPNLSKGEAEPSFLLNMIPNRQGKMVVLPKGQKPGQSMGQPQSGYQQQGQQQNNYQGQSGHISQSVPPMSDPRDPGPSGQNNW